MIGVKLVFISHLKCYIRLLCQFLIRGDKFFPKGVVSLSKINSHEKNERIETGVSYYQEGSHFDHKIPCRVNNKKNSALFLEQLKASLPKLFVFSFHKMLVYGKGLGLVTDSGFLLGDVSRPMSKSVRQHPIFEGIYINKLKKLDEVGVFMAVPSGGNYFHWMFDVLPRFELLNRAGVSLDEIKFFLVNPIKWPFQKDTLKLLNINQGKLMELTDQSLLECQKLIVPSRIIYGQQVPSWACEYVGNLVLNSIKGQLSENESLKKIFVSRRKAKGRKISNYQEMASVLKSAGFEELELESMSIQDQAKAFYQSNTIVALHGAGLTNLTFCRPETKILEIFSPHYVNPCYWQLANRKKCSYYYMYGEGCCPDFLRRVGYGNLDIKINVEELKKALKTIAKC